MRVLLVGLVLVSAAPVWADDTPPAGFKRMPLDWTISTETEHPEWVFFVVIGSPDGPVATRVAFDPKTPIVVAGTGRGSGIGRTGYLAAVPIERAEVYASAKELLDAVRDRSVPGLFRGGINLDSLTTVAADDPRTVAVRKLTVRSIDDEDGILFAERSSKDDERLESVPGEASTPAVFGPAGGPWLAGLVVGVAATLMGVWLVRQTQCRAAS